GHVPARQTTDSSISTLLSCGTQAFTSPSATKTPTSLPTSCGGTSPPATQPRCDSRSYPGPDRPDLYWFPVCLDLIARPRIAVGTRAVVVSESTTLCYRVMRDAQTALTC